MKLHPIEEEKFEEKLIAFRKVEDKRKYLVEQFYLLVDHFQKQTKMKHNQETVIRETVEALMLRLYKKEILKIIAIVVDDFTKMLLVSTFEAHLRKLTINMPNIFWEEAEIQSTFCLLLKDFIMGETKLLKKDKEKPLGSLVSDPVKIIVDTDYVDLCEVDLGFLKTIKEDTTFNKNAEGFIEKNKKEIIERGIKKFSEWSYGDVLRCLEKFSRL